MCSPGGPKEKSDDLEFVFQSQSQRQIKNLEFTKQKAIESQNKGSTCNSKERPLRSHQFVTCVNIQLLSPLTILTWLISGASPSPFLCLRVPRRGCGDRDPGGNAFQTGKATASSSVITAWLLLSDFQCYCLFLRPASWWS